MRSPNCSRPKAEQSDGHRAAHRTGQTQHLGLGAKRSIRKLLVLLHQSPGKMAPSLRTTARWCSDGHWVQAAVEYDAHAASVAFAERRDLEDLSELARHAGEA